MTMKPLSMAAGEFKTHCLKVMDRVQRDRRPVIITKKGKPVAKLVPLDPESKHSIFGCLAGEVEVMGDIMAPIVPAEEWDASK